MSRALVAFVLGLALCATPAGAWTPPPTTDEGRLTAFLTIARAAWPGSPCAGREVVHLHADSQLDQLDGAVGSAWPPTCEVYMRSGLSAKDFCSTLVHEFGHDAGYGHTDDPDDVHAPPGSQANVMASHGADWPACVVATTPTARYQAEVYVRQLLPWDGYGWRATCTPMRDRRPRCRATMRGARPRRFSILVVAGQVVSAEPVQGSHRNPS